MDSVNSYDYIKNTLPAKEMGRFGSYKNALTLMFSILQSHNFYINFIDKDGDRNSDEHDDDIFLTYKRIDDDYTDTFYRQMIAEINDIMETRIFFKKEETTKLCKTLMSIGEKMIEEEPKRIVCIIWFVEIEGFVFHNVISNNINSTDMHQMRSEVYEEFYNL